MVSSNPVSAGDQRLPMSAKLTENILYIYIINSIHVPGTTICIYTSKNAYVFEIMLCTVLLYLYILDNSYYLYFAYRILLMSVPIDGCTWSWEGLETRLAADTPTRYYNTGIHPKWVMG